VKPLFIKHYQIEGQSEPLLVNVQEGATVLDMRGDEDTIIDFDDINLYDQIRWFGLDPCPGDVEFHAFVILIPEDET
jgi:hypothetical protein